MNELFQWESQVIKPTSLLELLHYEVGKDWASPFFTPSKTCRPFYSLSVLSSSFTVSEHLWLTYSTERIKFSNQKVYWYFPPPPPKCSNLCIYLSELILPNSGVRKDWADSSLTYSNNHFKLRTYSFCILHMLTIYHQILLHPLHFCAVLMVLRLYYSYFGMIFNLI